MPGELIDQFLRAQLPLTDVWSRLNAVPNPSWTQFGLRIGDPVLVHQSLGIPNQSFEWSRLNAINYLNNIPATYVHDGWISVREKLTDVYPRPSQSRPIYFITAEDQTSKTIVYVGQTSRDSGRFDGGHAAITKLHDPSYDGKVKRVYMCGVLVRIDEEEWVSIEFLRLGRLLLSQLESQLIFQLDPVFNAPQTKQADAAQFVVIHDNRHKFQGMDGKFFDGDGLHGLPSEISLRASSS